MKQFFKYLFASILGVLLAGILMLVIISGIFSAILSLSESPVTVKDKSLLVLSLEEIIVERAVRSPLTDALFSDFASAKQLGLDEILKAIDRAKTDEKIKGIYMNPSFINAGLGTVEEIRQALVKFKESGKFIYAYVENLSQKAYYLISVADTIVLNPQGMIEFKGLSAQSVFYKKALEKIGVEVQVVRHGKFKAAVEPFLLEEMSNDNKLQTKIYLESMWNKMLTDISGHRNLSVSDLNELANKIATFQKAEFMREAGLVDALKYKDEVLSELKAMTYIDEKNDLRAIGVLDYLKSPAKTDGKGLERNKIAVIYANGDIDMGRSGINSEEISRTIREARRDTAVKAIVLRINSPGGAAYGAEIIWREVKLASEVKPVVASMGSMAASGGYYIAAAADTIMANHTTITGSIGVFGVFPNAKKLLNEKLGISVDGLNTNEHSDILSASRGMDNYEKALLQEFIENTYDVFVERVADGRELTAEQVDELGQGRVWDGKSAVDIGLVDVFGGVDDAIKLAAEMSNLKRYRVVQLPALEDPLNKLFKDFPNNVHTYILKKELGENYALFNDWKIITESKGIMARLPYSFELN